MGPLPEPAFHQATRARLLRDSTWIFGVVSAILALLYVWLQGLGADSHAYWLAWHGPMYTTGPMTQDAFLYSPAFAQALWPAAQLPWQVFSVLFSAGLGIALAWLLAPLGCRWAIPLWLAGLPEITSGNVFILLAVAAVGFRRPEAWVFPALTKVTVCVGPLWFLARGEWRRLAISLTAIAAVAAVSAATAPDLWSAWLRFLVLHGRDASQPLGSSVMPPALVRVPFGLALLIWGARTNKTWAIPVSMLLCTPVLWLGSLTLLAAIPRLRHPIARA
jgi:hypothetical protein